MLKKIAVTGTILAALAVVAYVFVLPRGRARVASTAQFTRPADEHYAALAKHRAAQRAQPTPATAGAGERSTAPAAPEPLKRTDTREDPRPSSAYWTGFRGPDRSGHYGERTIQTSWPATLTALWKQPIGAGHSSFAIANGRAFTIEQRGGDELVSAYSASSGRELWAHPWRAAFREAMGGDGPRATPTWHAGVLYALGAQGELRALRDTDGSPLWRTNILESAAATNLEWGMAGSPLVVDDLVIVTPGGLSGRSVVAYNRTTGQPAWSALDDRQSYASPQLAILHGIRQVLIFTASRLVSIRPEDGTTLWEFPWRGGGGAGINVAQPIAIGDRVFISTGYGIGGAMLQIERSGSGFSARELWRNNRMKNTFTTSVHHEGFIYGLDDGILACIDAATGERRWKAGRYGDGQVLLASGHLIVSTDTGELALVRATPERHDERARSPAIQGRTWNHPAMADGLLLIRNSNEMAAFDLNRR